MRGSSSTQRTPVSVCNATSSELLGLTVEQMTGKTAIDPAWCFITDAGNPMALEDYPVNRVLASGEPLRNLVVGIKRPLGQSLVWALCNAFPFRDAQGALERIVVTFIDISDQRQAQEEARQLEAQLIETQRMESIGKLAGGVAHDFNNLLTAIIGACDLAQLRGNDPLDLQRRMGDIRRTAMRATDLTQQLLAFGRKQILQPRLVDINEVIQGFGYTVHTAGNPDEAIRRFQGLGGTVRLLLTDVVLPGASGKQLATQLSIASPGLKVLYMSGYTDNVIVHHGMLERGTQLIEKPFSAIDLAKRVRQVLDA